MRSLLRYFSNHIKFKSTKLSSPSCYNYFNHNNNHIDLDIIPLHPLANSISTATTNTATSSTASSTASNYKKDLSIVSLNILSPIYKTLNISKIRESELENEWSIRNIAIINLLVTLNSSIICLQELWFYDKFLSLYETKLNNYNFLSVKRNGNKNDGLAILIKDNITLIDSVDVDFENLGSNRVAQIALLSLPNDDNNISNLRRQIIVVNTHFTFPHHAYDIEVRGKQALKLVNSVNDYISQKGLYGIPTFMVGDFNGNGDNVSKIISNESFVSTYCMVNGADPQVTHLNHRRQQVAVDFIYMKNYEANSNNVEQIVPPITGQVMPLPKSQRYFGTNSLSTNSTPPNVKTTKSCPKSENNTPFVQYHPKEAFLLPTRDSASHWPNDWALSDHRPIVACFESVVPKLI